jgi:glycosyltransferase involved in cell wall biosynthesis
MNIALFGGECLTCQIPRIKQGLILLNHNINYENPDIIYSNDTGGYKDALELKESKGGYLILNILDIPWHLSNVDVLIEEWSYYLNKADAITTISETVRDDLQDLVDKEVSVIYNPVKDVFYDSSLKKDKVFLYVGRANDFNKRIGLVYQTLSLIENGLSLINICGNENPNFGKYIGPVSDEDLNIYYNTSKFLFLPSKNEGIGLPMIEALICGSIPITCLDNVTAHEFSPPEFLVEPNPSKIANKIYDLNKNYQTYQKIAIKYGEKYKAQFNKVKIAENIINVYNTYNG